MRTILLASMIALVWGWLCACSAHGPAAPPSSPPGDGAVRAPASDPQPKDTGRSGGGGGGRGGDASVRGEPPGAVLPAYPWPPEAPTWRIALGHAPFAPEGAAPSQHDVWMQLRSSLTGAGYYEISVYSAPGGFAAVSRLEAVDENGRPLPGAERFKPPAMSSTFSLREYVAQLFFAPEGFYRFVVFVVTDQAFTTSASALSEEEALLRLQEGASTLPSSYKGRPFSEQHQVYALVYEYRKAGATVDLMNPGKVAPENHLASLGLLSLVQP